MNKSLAVSLLAATFCFACSGAMTTPDAGTSPFGFGGGFAGGTSGGGTGGGTTGGGTTGGGTTGGGTTGGGTTGGGTTGGGGGGSAGFTLSGTVQAPSGGDVNSTVILACAWINDDCDSTKSLGVQLTGSGASGQWQITGLENGLTYFLVFWKDMNGSNAVDNGDYTAVGTDSQGNVRPFTEAASGITTLMAVKQTVPMTTVPASLVGDWWVVNTNIGVTNRWSFLADGSTTNEFTFNSATCSGGGTATLTHGRISVTGNELTFVPTDSTRNYRCNGQSTITTIYANQRRFQWRIGPSTKMPGANALFMIDLGLAPADRVEAEYQVL
ncbi:MAG: hypothetical protein QM817_36610 [Archangium sp.]